MLSPAAQWLEGQDNMKLSDGLSGDTIEELARLWTNKDFQELVSVLKTNRENYGRLCLTATSWDTILELQWKAHAFSLVIKTVEDCFKKVNK